MITGFHVTINSIFVVTYALITTLVFLRSQIFHKWHIKDYPIVMNFKVPQKNTGILKSFMGMQRIFFLHYPAHKFI